MVTFDFSESDEDIINPERGFYVGYHVVAADADGVRPSGHSLAIAMVRLDAYRNAAIDDAFLATLTTGFAAVRDAGFKVILRFAYNSSESADASRERILEHLDQLRPILQANVDVIAVMQAGFIGAWGEWHSSTNGLGNTEDRTAILNGILAALPASRGVQVRTPMYKEEIYGGGPLDESEAYDGSPRARVGHHNDCFLASASDYGTYDSPVSEWLEYVADDGRYTAIGGETCHVFPERSDCEAAVAEMEANHWSYLNEEYNQDVLDGWAEQGCLPEVQRRLGYRFSLAQVAHSDAVAPGGALALEIELRNTGFAAPYNRRPVEIVLTGPEGTRLVARLSGADARRWAPGGSSTIATLLRIPATLAAGTYTLSLRLPDDESSLADDARYAIRLANDDVWNAETGDNVLSTVVVIDPSTPGPRDLDATSFVEL